MITLDGSTMHTLAHGSRLLVALALIAACPADDVAPVDATGTMGTTAAVASTGGTTSTLGASESGVATMATDPTAADSTGAPPLDACACMGPDPFDSGGCGTATLDEWVPGCPLILMCPVVTAICPGIPDLYLCRADLVFDEPALQCAIEALRDGTPGRIQISEIDYQGQFSPGSDALVHVLEDRMAVRLGCTFNDAAPPTPGSPRVYTLADPAYFTACLDEPVPVDRYTCMLAGLGEGTELPACPG
jgi:hypothetical protein